MTLPLVLRGEVRDEVDEAYIWYQRQRTRLGEEFLAAVQSTLDRVQENPGHHGAAYRDIRAALVRRFPYVVYYRIESQRIVVIAIQHGHRDQGHWKSRA